MRLFKPDRNTVHVFDLLNNGQGKDGIPFDKQWFSLPSLVSNRTEDF